MSVVSTTHDFTVLDKNSKAMAGQRLVRLIAKKPKDGEYHQHLKQSLCVSVPVLTVESIEDDQWNLLKVHAARWLQGVQDTLIREFRLEHGKDEIREQEFSIDACIAHLEASATDDRVSMEYLQEWFTEEYGDIATEWIQGKAPGLDATIVGHKVNVLRDMFAGFSSNRYSPEIPKLRVMVEFVGAIPDESMDARMVAYGTKAAEMLEAKEAALNVDALGF